MTSTDQLVDHADKLLIVDISIPVGIGLLYHLLGSTFLDELILLLFFVQNLPLPHQERGRHPHLASPELSLHNTKVHLNINTFHHSSTLDQTTDLHKVGSSDEPVSLLVKHPEGLAHLILYLMVLELPDMVMVMVMVMVLSPTLSLTKQTH